MNIAIVTGASSGLGREFVLQLARTEKHLDEIWVIARRKDRLEALRAHCPVPLQVLALDLTVPASIDALQTALQAAAPHIQVLVNAAGFGRMGDWQAVGRRDSAAMIQLNCQAAVEVTQLCLPYMGPGSRILEICSSSAFQPLPYLNVYAATKVFLYHYSLALGWELRSRQITVTAVCPYWIQDTEFIQVAKQSGGQTVRSFPFATTARRVVIRALCDSHRGQTVSTPGPFCTVHHFASKCIPSQAMMALWEGLRRL